MKIGYVYDAGGRSLNEDALLYRESLFKSGTLALAAVCDGMGGMDEGEAASSLCISELEDFYDHVLIPFITDCGQKGRHFRRALDIKMIAVFKKINDLLFERMRREKVFSGSTMTVCLMFNDRYRIYHIGDSRAYRLMDIPGIKTVFFLRTKDDIRDKKLSRCVGLNRDHKPQIRGGYFKKGGMLICSDGFYKRCDERNLKSALYLTSLTDNTAINKRLSALCEDVKKRGEKDNITAIMIVK